MSAALRRLAPRPADLVALAVLAGLAAAILLRRLGIASLQGDEAIFAQVARQAAGGELLPLRYLSAVFHDKPPLVPWLLALGFRTFGESEWVARLPSALAGIALVLLVYRSGSRLFSRQAGFFAAAVLLTPFNFLFVHGLRDAVSDPCLILVWSAAGLLYLEERTGARPPGRHTVLLCGVLLGVGLLVKTVVALLGVGIVGLFVLLFPRPEEGGILTWRRWRDPLGLGAVAVALYVPWLVVMSVATGGQYVGFLLVTDLLARATHGMDSTHLQPVGIYAKVLVVDFRWKLLVLAAVPAFAWLDWRAGRRMEVERVAYLGLWAGVVLGLFGLSASRLSWYIYPAYPALALLFGWGASRILTLLASRPGRSWRLAPALGLLLIAAVLGRGLYRSWVAAGEDTAAIDAHRLAQVWAQTGRPATCIEQGLKLREWNVFYLRPLARRWIPPGQPGDCECVIARDPRLYLPTTREVDRQARLLHKFDGREADTWFVWRFRELPREISELPPP